MNENTIKPAHEAQNVSVVHTLPNGNRVHEFATVEGLLRYDAEHTLPPAGLTFRVQQSVAEKARAALPWWQRLFRK